MDYIIVHLPSKNCNFRRFHCANTSRYQIDYYWSLSINSHTIIIALTIKTSYAIHLLRQSYVMTNRRTREVSHLYIVAALSNSCRTELLHCFEYLDLPFTPARFDALDEEDYDYVEDRGDIYRVDFDPDAMKVAASSARPFVPNLDEFKLAFCSYLKERRADLLDCMVEQYLINRGHQVLWTPPYCPKLQPIELYWAGGKNHAATNYYGGRSMKETVNDLREGWYGNAHLFPNGPLQKNRLPTLPGSNRPIKYPIRCNKLVATAHGFIDSMFIKICDGISGTLQDLTIDEDYETTTEGMPMDMLLVSTGNIGTDTPGNDPEEECAYGVI